MGRCAIEVFHCSADGLSPGILLEVFHTIIKFTKAHLPVWSSFRVESMSRYEQEIGEFSPRMMDNDKAKDCLIPMG